MRFGLIIGACLAATVACLSTLPPLHAADGSACEDAGPRKVVIGTAIHPYYHFPGQEKRLREIETLIDKMARQAEQKYPGQGLDLVVLPEQVLNVGSGRTPAERAVRLNGPEMQRMQAKARQHQTYIVVPATLVEGDDENTYYNTGVVLDRKGNDVGIYRKVHPVAPYDSPILERGITPGTEFPVFDCDFGKLGVQICWDLSYEDGWTALLEKGAEIVALLSASPQTVRPASYALDGRYYVISSTPRNNASFFNPVGRIEAQIREPGVCVHQIDLSYARLCWSVTLDGGLAFKKTYGDRAGYIYYEDEDCGLFWSNDPAIPIRQMTEELGQMEMNAHIERTRRLQDAARKVSLDDEVRR